MKIYLSLFSFLISEIATVSFYRSGYFPGDEPIEPPCRQGFKNLGGSCYRIIVVGGDHQKARALCKVIGPDIDLATIRCLEENDAIYEMAKEQWVTEALDELKKQGTWYDGYSWNMWIGLHGSDASIRPDPSQWYIDKAQRYPFRNWASRQPNNLYGRESCAYMYIRQSYIHGGLRPWEPGTWNDWVCSKNMFAAVCEQLVETSGQSCIRPRNNTKGSDISLEENPPKANCTLC